jgi:hypothetical protein
MPRFILGVFPANEVWSPKISPVTWLGDMCQTQQNVRHIILDALLTLTVRFCSACCHGELCVILIYGIRSSVQSRRAKPHTYTGVERPLRLTRMFLMPWSGGP